MAGRQESAPGSKVGFELAETKQIVDFQKSYMHLRRAPRPVIMDYVASPASDPQPARLTKLLAKRPCDAGLTVDTGRLRVWPISETETNEGRTKGEVVVSITRGVREAKYEGPYTCYSHDKQNFLIVFGHPAHGPSPKRVPVRTVASQEIDDFMRQLGDKGMNLDYYSPPKDLVQYPASVYDGGSPTGSMSISQHQLSNPLTG